VPYALAMTAGFGLAIGGLAVAAPALVGLVGRVAGRLPLSGRLAVRDAARHRHRTGPAVAATMVAVTGSVAVLFAVASYDRHDRAQYRPSAPLGAVSLYAVGGTPDADLLAGAQAAAVELPGARVVPVRWSSAGPADDDQLSIDIGDEPPGPGCAVVNLAAVGTGADLASVLAGPRAGTARAALASGRAVVFGNCLLDGGQLRLSRGVDRWRSIPAVQFADKIPYPGLPSVVLPDSLVAQAKIRTTISSVLITTSRPPTGAEEDRARGVLGDGVNLTVERGYGAPYRLGILTLVGVAGLITLAGVLISVTLSAAEGQADLATLAAIGATPRRRRALAAWQAGLIGGLGVLPGLLLGAAVGRIVMLAQTGYPLVLPWPAMLAIGLGVPALGVLVVGVTTRARLPMVRRLA
jgi:putative ABC transport system permease protein